MDENSYLEVRDKYIVKSNDLIQRSRFKLNLQQQKAILFLVSQIQPSDDDFKEYTFEIRDFCRICGIDAVGGKQYDLLKAALKELRDKSLYIMIDKNTETLVSWLDHVTFYKDSGLVSVSLDKAMKPYLLHLHENFTKYELIYTLRMKHSTTPRLYELLKSFHYDDLKPYTIALDLDELRMRLDAEKKTYQEYKYFKRYIIDPSVKEINEQTDIKVSVRPLKKKRMVYALEFTIERQKTPDILSNALETDKAFLDKLKEPKASKKKPKQKKQTEQQQKEKSKAGTELKEETQLEQPQEAAEKPTEPLEYDFSTAKKNPYTEKLDPAQKEASTPAAQDAEPAGKPKRIQIRIFLKSKKGKPIKCFSSYDRTELDAKANQWLKENGYPLYSTSVGTSFRWEVE